MKQHDAMARSGGYATLGSLYVTVVKIPGVKWRTKTPLIHPNRRTVHGRIAETIVVDESR